MKRYCLLFSMIFVMISSLATADDASFGGDGADVYPLQNADIDLVSEVISITDNRAQNPGQHGWKWSIHVDMKFKNEGPDATVQMGFPFGDEFESDDDDKSIKYDFKTWIDGKEAVITRKKGGQNPADVRNSAGLLFPDVYTYPVNFKKGETKNIVHSYGVNGWSNVVMMWKFTYILRTGALWKGPIEDLKIFYKTNEKGATRNYLGCITPREHSAELIGSDLVLSWHYKNYKPKTDLVISGGGPGEFEFASVPIEDRLNEDRETFTNMNSCYLRFIKNSIFAKYGYPFKNPYIRSQFYFSGSNLKEDPNFKMAKIPKEYLELSEYLSKLEDKNAAIEEDGTGTLKGFNRKKIKANKKRRDN